MHIWLITIGEPLPTDGGGERLLRTGLLAQTAAARGHCVTWWTSSFDHVRKKHRRNVPPTVDLGNGLRIRLLKSRGYQTNVSLRRLFDHRDLAHDFRSKLHREWPPDVILCSLPTLELCNAAVEYGERTRTPVVIDIRDMWPDAIADLAPNWARLAARWALAPMYRAAQEALTGAAAVTSITEEILKWGLDRADRPRHSFDRAFPLGYPRQTPPLQDIRNAESFWDERGITGSAFTVCFFGTIGRHFEWPIVIDAARRLHTSGRDIRFVLCGAGPQLEQCRKLALGLPNVDFPGWMNAAEIHVLMQRSAVGIAPYKSTPDFERSLPNKSIEYLAGGLPIVSSLQGVLARLLDDEQCGVTYPNGNAEALTQTLGEMQSNSMRVRKLSSSASNLYGKRFVAETVYADMLDWLIDIGDQRRAAAA